MDDTAFIPIGRVVKPHGLSGEVSVRLEPGVETLPPALHVWFVPPPSPVREAMLLSQRRGPKGLLLTLSGVEDIETASTLRGATIMARPADLPGPIVDSVDSLVGYRVVDEDRGELGFIEELLVTGANDVWIVQGGDYGQVLIPVIDDVVTSVDDDTRSVLVRLLPGLIDEETS